MLYRPSKPDGLILKVKKIKKKTQLSLAAEC